jgi:hypothetical protein
MRERTSVELHHVRPCVGLFALSFVRKSLERCTQLVNIPDGSAIDSAGPWHPGFLHQRAKFACRDADRRCGLNLSEPEYDRQRWQYVDSCGHALHKCTLPNSSISLCGYVRNSRSCGESVRQRSLEAWCGFCVVHLLMILSMQANADHPSLAGPHWRNHLGGAVIPFRGGM